MFTHTLPKPLPQLVLGQTFQKEVLEKARWKQDAESKGEEENQIGVMGKEPLMGQGPADSHGRGWRVGFIEQLRPGGGGERGEERG